MLLALISGRALTAKELAYIARVTPQTTKNVLPALLGLERAPIPRCWCHRGGTDSVLFSNALG
jgi:hypothetical protein